LQHPVGVEQGAGQVASTVFEVFGMTRPGFEPNLPASVMRANKELQYMNDDDNVTCAHTKEKQKKTELLLACNNVHSASFLCSIFAS